MEIYHYYRRHAIVSIICFFFVWLFIPAIILLIKQIMMLIKVEGIPNPMIRDSIRFWSILGLIGIFTFGLLSLISDIIIIAKANEGIRETKQFVI